MAIPTLADVPYHLMPVAAGLGYYFIIASFRALFLLFKGSSNETQNSSSNKNSTSGPGTPRSGSRGGSKNSSSSREAVQFYAVTAFLALVAYTYSMGRIEGAFVKAAHASFDPYHILDLPSPSPSPSPLPSTSSSEPPVFNMTIVTAAYREKVQYYHPSNAETGNADELRRVMLAYQSLTEEPQKRNLAKYGHPSGPLLTSTFQLVLPQWLFPWSSRSHGDYELEQVRNYMLAVYIGMTISVLVAILVLRHRAAQQKNAASNDDDDSEIDFSYNSNSVQQVDLIHLAKYAQPSMSPRDILLLVVSCPTNLRWSAKDLERVDKIRHERLEESNKQASRKTSLLDFDSMVDEGGWADDNEIDGSGAGDGSGNINDKDEQEAAAKKEEEEKKKELERLNAATGKTHHLLEDLDRDKGVLGQQWVERTLASKGEWPPPDSKFLDTHIVFEYNGQKVSALEHPAMRRMLCMISGRLNSLMLNSHPELLEAGTKKLIDQTYFGASLIFRQRISLQLEALLRVGTMLHCYKLVNSAIDAATYFKQGCKEGSEKWFAEQLQRTYGCFPELKLHSKSVSTPDEKEVATGDEAVVEFEVERTHAENFLRQKLAQCQKQGIPPQIGLQSFREVWWLLLRCERIDGGTAKAPPLTNESLKDLKMDAKRISLFEKEDFKDRLVSGFPMVIANISQKSVKARIQLDAPADAGRYRITVLLKSHEFLGSRLEFSVDVDVVDAAKVVRKEKKKDGEESKKKK